MCGLCLQRLNLGQYLAIGCAGIVASRLYGYSLSVAENVAVSEGCATRSNVERDVLARLAVALCVEGQAVELRVCVAPQETALLAQRGANTESVDAATRNRELANCVVYKLILGRVDVVTYQYRLLEVEVVANGNIELEREPLAILGLDDAGIVVVDVLAMLSKEV